SGVALTGIELFSFYLPIYGRAIGLAPSTIGMILSSYALAGFAVRVVMYRLAQRFTDVGVLTGSLFLAALAYLAIPGMSDAALLAEELPEADCPPVRVKILGERLIAFRDTSGKLGLIDEFCAHRGVSLWFGRNEENGLRCSYHGWKYDVNGQCTEIPSEPNN